MAKRRAIYEENIGRLDINAEYGGEPIFADEEFQQAFSYLLGWISTTRAWKPILADVDGRMLVSTSPTKSEDGNHSNPAPSTSSITVLARNVDRKLMIIQNTGTIDCFLSFDGAAAVVTDFLLEAGATYIDNVYFGLVTGITASGTAALNVTEMT